MRVPVMANQYTEILGNYPYTRELRRSEGSRAKRYVDPGTDVEAIGYGHLIESEEAYATLASQLGFKDKENLSESERRVLLNYDIDLRRRSMSREYPTASQGIKDAMLSVRYQFNPGTFDKHFGAALRNRDIPALKAELKRLGDVFQQRGLGGVNSRWKRIQKRLDNLGE